MNPVSTNAPVGDTGNIGTVVSVRGSIVEARFDEHLPAINTVLLAGPEGQIVIEVLAQSDDTATHRDHGTAIHRVADSCSG